VIKDDPRQVSSIFRILAIPAGTWLAIATLTAIIFPSVGGGHLLLTWPADAVAYGFVLAWGLRVIPSLAISALLWNLLIWQADILNATVGATAFAITMVLIRSLDQYLTRHRDEHQGTSPMREPLFAVIAASIYTAVGSWQFPFEAIGTVAITWLSVATPVLLFTHPTRCCLKDNCCARTQWRQSLAELQLHAIPLGLLGLLLTGYGLTVSTHPLWAFVWMESTLAPLIWLGLTLSNVPARAVLLVFALTASLIQTWLLPGDSSFKALIEHQLWLFVSVGSLIVLFQLRGQKERLHDRLMEAEHHDPATGLLNNAGLNHLLQSRDIQPDGYVLIAIDLLDYEEIETLAGFEYVSSLERKLARLMQSRFTDTALLARVRAGLMVCLIPDGRPEELQTTIVATLAPLPHQYRFEGTPLRIAMAGFRHLTTKDLPNLNTCAQMACYRASQANWNGNGHGNGDAILWFDRPDELLDQQRRDYQLLRHMRGALNGHTGNGRFVLYCQRIANLQHPLDRSFEVLLRWQMPEGEIRSPAYFMPIAERYGLMHEIDFWVMDTCLKTLTDHADQTTIDHADKIALNLSGMTLAQPGLAGHVTDLLNRYRFPARHLCFEVTESKLIENYVLARDNLEAIRALGCRIALDDFGTGLATFDYLKRFPYDILKIDGSFIRDLAKSTIDQTVVRAIESVAKVTGTEVVAEYVETDTQIAILRKLGIDQLQGYGIHVPEALATYLDRRAEEDLRKED